LSPNNAVEIHTPGPIWLERMWQKRLKARYSCAMDRADAERLKQHFDLEDE